MYFYFRAELRHDGGGQRDSQHDVLLHRRDRGRQLQAGIFSQVSCPGWGEGENVILRKRNEKDMIRNREEGIAGRNRK